MLTLHVLGLPQWIWDHLVGEARTPSKVLDMLEDGVREVEVRRSLCRSMISVG